MDINHVTNDPAVWEEAINKLRGRLMPPAGQPQPDQEIVDQVVSYLENSIDTESSDHVIGHVPIQRLNRTEFATIVGDLLGVDVDPVQILPSEIEVEGFDNIANALGASLHSWNNTSRRPAPWRPRLSVSRCLSLQASFMNCPTATSASWPAIVHRATTLTAFRWHTRRHEI